MLAPLQSIHTIVTDKQTPDGFIQEVQKNGINVLLA
jgi:DeoR/GlpR family transcriptional regulator of sugar metabolism